jgi:hypothetical protein
LAIDRTARKAHAWVSPASVSLGILAVLVLGAGVCEAVSIKPIPGQAELGWIEVHGVGAGEFDPNLWRAGTLHWVPDVRSPLIRPRVSGVFRNIYAPSAVEVPGGWRVFYGAWDGVPTGNDRIYSLRTADFLDLSDRTTVIEHGGFIHVCNVSALRFDDGSFHLACTVYPDARDRNKPATFHSPDGNVWNGSPAPYAAKASDIVEIDGYPPYADADINGVNVLFYESGTYRLYFSNWRDPGQVYRASGQDGKRFRFEGPCLKSNHGVNDVKGFVVGGRPCYLMGLHRNCDRLWYSLSTDSMHFEPERELVNHLGDADRYIVAIGWVVRGQRLLGFLYGAGAVPGLDRNRIFARWLQKKVVFVGADGKRYERVRSLGPDRQLIELNARNEIQGHFEVFGEDGKTRLGPAIPGRAVSGAIYELQ